MIPPHLFHQIYLSFLEQNYSTPSRCGELSEDSSEVERSILHGVDTFSYFSFQPVLHDWCNKGRGMCYSVCGMVHIKEPLKESIRVAYVAAVGFLSHYQNGP